jgi:hypothetical protein
MPDPLEQDGVSGRLISHGRAVWDVDRFEHGSENV